MLLIFLVACRQTLGDYLRTKEDQPTKPLSMFELRTETVKSTEYWKQDVVYLTANKDNVNNSFARLTVSIVHCNMCVCVCIVLPWVEDVNYDPHLPYSVGV
jgi:hypothetical protein